MRALVNARALCVVEMSMALLARSESAISEFATVVIAMDLPMKSCDVIATLRRVNLKSLSSMAPVGRWAVSKRRKNCCRMFPLLCNR